MPQPTSDRTGAFTPRSWTRLDHQLQEVSPGTFQVRDRGGRQLGWITTLGPRFRAHGDAQTLEPVARRIRARGGWALVVPADLRDPDAAGAAAERILAEAGTPEIVVSNAGHSIRRRLVDYADRPHDVTRTIGVNYVGPVALLQVLVPAMIAAGRGQIVSIGSTSIDVPAPGWSVYGASKTAFDAWLRAVAPELTPHGIAVTSIHLPLVRTQMSAPTYGNAPVAMRPVDASKLIARAIVDRPRLISPWWSRLAGALLVAFPALGDRMLRAYDRRLGRER